MPYRAFLPLLLASLFSAAALIFWGSLGNSQDYKNGYAALVFDGSVDDKAVSALMNQDNGELGKPGLPSLPVITEFTQWVLLDEFDSLAMIPLGEYLKRIEPFDPRNDGYADKLKKVFARDGKRFVYVPLREGNSNRALLEKQLANLLGDMPFTIKYFGTGRPLKLFFLLYAAASAGLLIICYAWKEKFNEAALLIPLLPALSSLAFFGAAGIGAASLYLGGAVLLREPLKELIVVLRLPEEGARKLRTLVKKAFQPYKLNWCVLPLFAAALAAFVFFTKLSALYIIAVSIAVYALFCISIVIFSQWRGRRKRFTPVLIINRKLPDFVFSQYMLPFALAAATAALLAPSVPGDVISNDKFYQLIDEKEYYEHLEFQASFSARQLGRDDAGYPGYILDEDGLLSPDGGTKTVPAMQYDDFPPFPLKDLMETLSGVNAGNRKSLERGGGEGVENLPLLMLLVFIIPGFFFKNSIFFSRTNRFSNVKKSEKLAWSDIDRKKALLYNKRNALRFLKDA